MRELCGFHKNYPFTIKWLDEDNDACTISTQIELEEAIRLYEVKFSAHF